jgi:hypothetical protein
MERKGTLYMAASDKKIVLSNSEICKNCPFHSGLAKGLKMAEKKLECLERKTREDTGKVYERIESVQIAKSDKKTLFWLVGLLILVGGSLMGVIRATQSSYQTTHGEIHQDLNTEIKSMNTNLIKEVHQISKDVSVIKAITEKNGGK